MKYRIEHDTMGEVKVPADRRWGAQTQRSLNNFRIGEEKMPIQLIYGFAHLKKACAMANNHFQKLEAKAAEAIVRASEEIIAGAHDREFPLSVWQTGSGTQTNMNMNEVIANLANQIIGKENTVSATIHPNDHVNMSQSSNDTFPSAMHIASVLDLDFAENYQGLEQRRKEGASAWVPIQRGCDHRWRAGPVRLGPGFDSCCPTGARARSSTTPRAA